MSTIHGFLFQVYPYICLTVLVVGSLIRFDQNQYSWKSDSSQLLRPNLLRWGSNLFHGGILFLFFGHLFGLFTPHVLYGIFMSAATKQQLAVFLGGIAGSICFVGLSMLLYRRLVDHHAVVAHLDRRLREPGEHVVGRLPALRLGELQEVPDQLHHGGHPFG